MRPSETGGDLSTLSTEAVLLKSTRRSLSSGSCGHAAAGFRVEAEKLSTDPVVVKASIGAPIRLALCIQSDVGSGKAAWTREGVVRVVRCVVQTGGSRRPQEVFHLFDRALRPLEASGRPSQVAHHVTILPRAGFSTRRAAEVGWRGVTIVNSPKQVADLMGCHHDAGVCSAVFDQRDAADLRETGVADAGTTDVGIPCCRSAHPPSFPSCHVQTS